MNLKTLARVRSTILITGETGTGKTTLAKKVHEISPRREKKFISVNLAGLSDELFLSELFGHKRGSFTGAYSDKDGFCDLVKGGTLFLDEVGDLSLTQQKYLLKFLDEKKFIPVGDTFEKKFEGVIIMATHKDLDELVSKGKFRQDLYFRIRIFTKELIPLRDLNYEIGNLIGEAVGEKNREFGESKTLSKEAFEALCDYHWPGNYRELKNTFSYLWTNTLTDRVFFTDLPEWIKQKDSVNDSSYHENLFQHEKKYLIKQLLLNNGKVNQTAKKIGLSKVTLISKIKKYTIDLEYIKIVSHIQKQIGTAC